MVSKFLKLKTDFNNHTDFVSVTGLESTFSKINQGLGLGGFSEY